ncbi:hypothetical protein RHSIM_Rhsim03G0160300 [Rhododendron simsii]|uniref:SWIM-type domain-containing protein n=1 Tax=Rhododendron simsii TaxID=118357 RepID=A0A834LVH4_RHOSS|nr:hypothetical protein RHSIM_Rhsim03G0160300 [Rhododendron simsii]
MDDNVQRNGKNVVIDICDDSSNDDGNDGNDEKRLDELTEEEVYQMTFDMHEDGETFYNAYAKVNGFSIRNYNMHKDNAGIVKSRKWVCSKEGYRDTKYLEREDRIRGPQALTCPAVFSITLERSSGKYLVNNFVSVHNHSMIGPCGVPFLRSHRKVSSSDKASANTMHKVGIKTNHIMDFAAEQSGGYESVGYTQKDLYNHFIAQRNIEVADGDAEGALTYLCAKAENDPLFYYKYDVDEQNRLNNLFWRDVTCRTDYMCFGDVLIFDSTYRTNAYQKPLVILAGVNSHFQIAIFGCALLTTETVETYTWVLERFLDSMNHKKPVSVMTDGDKAMRRAIKTVLPDVNHRLCKWHLKKNAVSNVHVPGFLADFEKCMSMSTEEEFEVAWKNLLDDYSLHQNQWAVDVYKKKTLWAEAYLRGIFFAGAKSTQRVEGMNAYMNRFLKLRLKLFEFVQAFDRALAKLRHNEAKLQVESVNSTPVLSTCMKRIEKYAADTYTRGIFNKFLKEIKKEQSLFKVDKVDLEDFRAYYLSRYQQPDATWSVNYQPNDGIMKCSCLKFESIGFPCQHMISVIKMEYMREIPSCLILQRWTKTAKSFLLHGSTQMPEWVTQTTRFGALSSACVEMCYYASHITKGYNETKEEITKLTSKMRELYALHVEEEQKNMRQNDNIEGTSMHFGVGDPVIIKGKGTHNLAKDFIPKTRKYGNCREPGHIRTKCPKLVHGDNVGNMNEDEDTYESDMSVIHQQSFTGRDSSIYHPTFMHTDYTTNGCESSVNPNLTANWSRNSESVQAQFYGSNVGGWEDDFG